MNPFKALQDVALGTVKNLYADLATWSPLAGGDAYTALVLFNEPTAKADVGDEDFEALTPKMECYDNVLPGLFESVRRGNNEIVVINGNEYYPLHPKKLHDGKTIIYTMSPA